MPSNFNDLASQIPGWGADLNPVNRPGVPREKTPPNGTGAHWNEPEQQETDVKIFVSIERPKITPVFGTSCPPKGLSGLIRTFAYRYSEGRFIHWLPLLLADRIDVIESALGDLFRGEAGNPIQEMGLYSEFRKGGRLARLAENPALGLTLASGVAALGFLLPKLISNTRAARISDQRGDEMAA